MFLSIINQGVCCHIYLKNIYLNTELSLARVQQVCDFPTSLCGPGMALQDVNVLFVCLTKLKDIHMKIKGKQTTKKITQLDNESKQTALNILPSIDK